MSMSLTESESRVWWDAVHLAAAVTQRGGYDQETLATNLHPSDALVPAFDHLTGPQPECEWLPLGVRIKDLAIRKLSNVTHRDLHAFLRLWTIPNIGILNLQAVGELA